MTKGFLAHLLSLLVKCREDVTLLENQKRQIFSSLSEKQSMIGFKKTEIVKKRIFYSHSSDYATRQVFMHVIGFCTTAKGYFQACALWYFWAFLVPAAVEVEGHQSDLL